MIVNLNFNLEAWIKHIDIEASSEKEAVDKLMKMTLAEIVEAGAIVDTAMSYKDIETEVSEYDLVIQVSKVEYDLDPDTMDTAVIEYLKNFLPKELTINLHGVTDFDDLEELIKDEILREVGYETKSFEFQTVEKR